MTLTCELDLDRVMMNQHAKYLGQIVLFSSCCCGYTDTRTRRTDCMAWTRRTYKRRVASFQSLCLWLTSSCAYHVVFLCWFTTLDIHNFLTSGLKRVSQILPNIDSLIPQDCLHGLLPGRAVKRFALFNHGLWSNSENLSKATVDSEVQWSNLIMVQS